MQPFRPACRRARTNAWKRNWLPRSQGTTNPAGRRSAIASVIASTATSMAERTTVAHDPVDAGILDRAQVELASRARAFRLNASEPLVDQVVMGRWTRFAAGARDRGRHARTDPGLTAARTTQGPVLRALANRRG